MVRRFWVVAWVVVAAVTAAACGGGDSADDPTLDSPTSTASAAGATTAPAGATTTVAAGPQANLTLRMTDVRLISSEEADAGMRVLLPAGVASATVTINGGLPSPNQVISVCQARELDRRLTGATCRRPASGEAVTVNLGSAASGIELVQVGSVGTGDAGNSALLPEVLVRYAASSREVSVRLQQIVGGDLGSRPTFALTPASADGAYRAQMNWTVIPVFGGSPSSGLLELVQGGNVSNSAQAGGGETRLTGNVAAPVGDTVIRAQSTGTSALVTPKLVLLLP